MAAASLWCGLKPSRLPCMTSTRKRTASLPSAGLLSDDLSEPLGYGGWGFGLGEGARPGVARLAGCVVVDVVLGLFQAEFEELAGGVEPVVWLGVSELSLHGREEEADDESSVVGLFPDDLLDRGCVAVVVDSGVGAVPVGVRWREHMSYYRGSLGERQGRGRVFGGEGGVLLRNGGDSVEYGVLRDHRVLAVDGGP